MTIQWDRFQREVFNELQHGKGNLVVVARAGSGKTTTIVEGLRYVPQHADALLCAFNKNIQRELKRRAPQHVQVQTLHSIGLRAIKDRRGSNVEVDGDKGKYIARQVIRDNRQKLLRQVGTRAARGRQRHRDPLNGADYTLRQLASLSKQLHVRSAKEIEDVARKFRLDDDLLPASALAPLAVECLQRAAANPAKVDFDDMLYLPAKLGYTPRANSFVFIDETQDLNPAQLWLAQSACLDSGRIVAIGDPRQAIYFWRGADRHAIPGMIKKLDANVLPLSVTYRCSTKIVDHVKRVVGGLDDLEARPGAPEGLVENYEWKDCMGVFGARPGDFILSRLNAPLMPIALHFLAHGRPCKVAGKDIGRGLIRLAEKSEAYDIADLVRYLREHKLAEYERLVAEDAEEHFERIKDECDALECVARQCDHVPGVIELLNEMFADETETGAITCSTVHKAKGLERDRVFLLGWTFRLGKTEEEDNIYYVGATRARDSLYLVGAPNHDDEGPDVGA